MHFKFKNEQIVFFKINFYHGDSSVLEEIDVVLVDEDFALLRG